MFSVIPNPPQSHSTSLEMTRLKTRLPVSVLPLVETTHLVVVDEVVDKITASLKLRPRDSLLVFVVAVKRVEGEGGGIMRSRLNQSRNPHEDGGVVEARAEVKAGDRNRKWMCRVQIVQIQVVLEIQTLIRMRKKRGGLTDLKER